MNHTRTVDREMHDWGIEETIAAGNHTGRRLIVEAGWRGPAHFFNRRDRTLYVLRGSPILWLGTARGMVQGVSAVRDEGMDAEPYWERNAPAMPETVIEVPASTLLRIDNPGDHRVVCFEFGSEFVRDDLVIWAPAGLITH